MPFSTWHSPWHSYQTHLFAFFLVIYGPSLKTNTPLERTRKMLSFNHEKFLLCRIHTFIYLFFLLFFIFWLRGIKEKSLLKD